jgi:linoleoyl-CoA desaturase
MTTTTTALGRTTAETYGFDAERLDQLAAELDAIRDRVLADLGEDDVTYIRRMIRAQRSLEVGGRAALFLGWLPPFWLVGTASLSISKILDNMEIGHNVMHGQYDWTRDPALSAQGFEWDTVCPGDQWRHSHNYLHHTFTNVIGKDRDVGYGVLRMTDEQPWSPWDLLNPVKATTLALLFAEGVMLHDVEVERIQSGERTFADAWPTLRDGLRKSARLYAKDYLLWPALTGPLFLSTLAANVTANVVRNVWAFSIIFCGHFPAGTHEFTEDECDGESKGHWYLRQILGSANIDGGPLFHIMSGNLSHQIEHHLFPDLPAHRYAEIAPEVREICARHGLPYTTGGFARQLGSVAAKIVRLALPGRRGPAPERLPVAPIDPSFARAA